MEPVCISLPINNGIHFPTLLSNNRIISVEPIDTPFGGGVRGGGGGQGRRRHNAWSNQALGCDPCLDGKNINALSKSGIISTEKIFQHIMGIISMESICSLRDWHHINGKCVFFWFHLSSTVFANRVLEVCSGWWRAPSSISKLFDLLLFYPTMASYEWKACSDLFALEKASSGRAVPSNLVFGAFFAQYVFRIEQRHMEKLVAVVPVAIFFIAWTIRITYHAESLALPSVFQLTMEFNFPFFYPTMASYISGTCQYILRRWCPWWWWWSGKTA